MLVALNIKRDLIRVRLRISVAGLSAQFRFHSVRFYSVLSQVRLQAARPRLNSWCHERKGQFCAGANGVRCAGKARAGRDAPSVQHDCGHARAERNRMNEAVGLFKYLDASKLVFFERCLVLLTPPIYLNDPWDFLPKGRIPSELEILNVWRESETDIARSAVIAVPTHFVQRERRERLRTMRADLTRKESLAAQGKYYQDQISKVVGVVSLTERPLSRLMWAHYAQSHTGFVAEFVGGEEGEKYGYTIRMCAVGPAVAGKVKYDTDFKQFTEDASNVQELCWSKLCDWEDEQEWRIIWPLQKSLTCTLTRATSGGRVARFCLPFLPRGLRRVIVGMRMDTKAKQRLCAMLGREEFKHVQRQITGIDPETGQLVLKPLESYQ